MLARYLVFNTKSVEMVVAPNFLVGYRSSSEVYEICDLAEDVCQQKFDMPPGDPGWA